MTDDATVSSSSSMFDAILLVSFGGPERAEDVLPFLENVVRGKDVPRERLEEAAEHYWLFDGVSPLGAQVRALLAALVGELNVQGPHLPVYWGNRNWHPMLADTLGEMAEDGVRHALAFVTSAFGSYPGCRQYVEDIQRARQEVGPAAPQVDKLRLFYNHPGFIEPMADRVWDALEQIPAERRDAARLIFTAHSLPIAMAAGSPYEEQLREAARLVVERLGRTGKRGQSPDEKGTVPFSMAYQSRSGRPSQPWLEPDVRDVLGQLAAAGETKDVVVAPLGFVCEHMETTYDLDVEAAALAEELGLNMIRAPAVGAHPRFVRMIRELIVERIEEGSPRLSLGEHGPWPNACPANCCRLP